jgi:hypothetical protein
MAFSAIITLASAGADAGPFNLYSNATSPVYGVAFETAVSRADLLTGYTSTNVPDGTSTVRVTSTGTCTNHVDIGVDDPTVEVYERCLDAFIAYIDTASGTDTAFAQDGGDKCYQHIDSGSLTAMEAAHPGMTEVPSLVSSTCRCV